jgi:hypothetical protein
MQNHRSLATAQHPPPPPSHKRRPPSEAAAYVLTPEELLLRKIKKQKQSAEDELTMQASRARAARIQQFRELHRRARQAASSLPPPPTRKKHGQSESSTPSEREHLHQLFGKGDDIPMGRFPDAPYGPPKVPYPVGTIQMRVKTHSGNPLFQISCLFTILSTQL